MNIDLSILPQNETILDYAPDSSEYKALRKAIDAIYLRPREVKMIIGGEEVSTNDLRALYPPHRLDTQVATIHYGSNKDVEKAIAAALEAKLAWQATPWEERLAIFRRVGELAATTYRMRLNAATMVGQSKNAYQAEIDSACELIDFMRFNTHFAWKIQQEQPYSPEGVQNQLEYRPLEGFVYALTPFNFTAIAANLAAAPAMMGNTVVWKAADTQVLAAQVIMELYKEAGLPEGVINLVIVDGVEAGKVVFNHPEFSGLHFTGSTGVFTTISKQIADNLKVYKNFPRIVGETGGKDFLFAHPSANAKAVAVALIRGAFEYQGQKCSAASRAYLPESLYREIEGYMLDMMDEIKTGPAEDYWNFVNAVIDEKAYEKITSYIQLALSDPSCSIIEGGSYSKDKGYFIEPTLIYTSEPHHRLMKEEIFGPVLTVYVYPDEKLNEMVQLVDQTTEFALTGAIFAEDEEVIKELMQSLKYAAGNFYINDKPTGAVVNQQPFGGARKSGTNDKAGSLWNLIRWLSPRTLKRNLHPPLDFKYPFMGE